MIKKNYSTTINLEEKIRYDYDGRAGDTQIRVDNANYAIVLHGVDDSREPTESVREYLLSNSLFYKFFEVGNIYDLYVMDDLETSVELSSRTNVMENNIVTYKYVRNGKITIFSETEESLKKYTDIIVNKLQNYKKLESTQKAA